MPGEQFTCYVNTTWFHWPFIYFTLGATEPPGAQQKK